MDTTNLLNHLEGNVAKFKFYLEATDGRELILNYDNESSELTYENGEYVVENNGVHSWNRHHKMDAGKRNLKTIKISLGLKCNYSCEYCSQRFIPRNADDSIAKSSGELENPEQIEAFIKKFEGLDVNGDDLRFEMWGST